MFTHMIEKQLIDNDGQVVSAVKYDGPILVGTQTCLEIIFPDPSTRPSFRTFNEWKNRRYFPSIKIGKRVFLDPDSVRKSLSSQFTIQGLND